MTNIDLYPSPTYYQEPEHVGTHEEAFGATGYPPSTSQEPQNDDNT